MLRQTLTSLALLSILGPTVYAAPVEAVAANDGLHRVQLRKPSPVRDGEHAHMAYERQVHSGVHRMARMTGGLLDERHGIEARIARRQAIAEGAHFSNFKRMYLADLPQLDLPSLVDVHSLLANAQTAEVQVQELVAGLVDGGASDVTVAPGYSAPANSSAARPVITNSTASSADSASSRTASIPAATTQAASNGTGVSSSPTVSQITASQSTAAQTSATQSTAGNSSTPVIVTQNGSNKDGFAPIDLAFIQSYQNTPSTVNAGYYAEIQIGSKGQAFNVLLDSGSADFWVKEDGCYYCGQQQGLGPAISNTFHLQSASWQAQYGSGSASGQLASDDVTIAGMTLKNHTFGVASRERQPASAEASTDTPQVSYQFANSSVPYDGLMGLAFRHASFQNVDTPIKSLKTAGLVSGAIMGYALDRVSDGENTGEAVFGGVDSSKIDAATTQTLPLTSTNGLWQAEMAAVTVGGKSIATNRQVIFDTGTTLVFAPTADADAFHAQIPGSKTDGQGVYTIPCTTDTAVFLQFGNAAFQMNPPDLLYQPVSADDLTGDCLSSIAGSNIIGVQNTWILGDAFIKNVYFATNEGARTVQLSGRTDSPTSSSYSAR